MKDTVQQILTNDKGVLALDWSPTTIAKQFEKIGLVSTPELNRVYRQMLVTTPDLNKYISGIILHEETVNQNLDNGESFPQFLNNIGVAVGVRGDKGGGKFDKTDEEITLGIEGLEDRLKDYYDKGVRFTKWRSCFVITDLYPSKDFLEANLDLLTRFAKISQDHDMVPFVEPEVTMNGKHTTTRCAEITYDVLNMLFQKLRSGGVDIQNIILKTNMVLPGRESGVVAAPLEVAEATLRTFRKSVPPEVPGIVFLSGGQTPDEATNNLNEIVKRKDDAPWDLSFSYARALQEEALNIWRGDETKISDAQEALVKRLKMVTNARNGKL